MMRGVLLTVAIFAALAAAVWYGVQWIPADFIYELETDFAAIPSEDKPLAEWGRAQPGVWNADVEREHIGARCRIKVIIGITQNGWRQPKLPDLDAAAAELGYKSPSRPFHDSPR